MAVFTTQHKGEEMEDINVLKKYVTKPYQRAMLKKAEIWQVREPKEWHIVFPDTGNVMLSCPDGRCPYDFHTLRDYSFSDPWSLGAVFRLEKGMKVLVLNEFCGKQYVSFFTFDHFNSALGHIKFFSTEKSRDTWFFKPTKKIMEDFGVTIQWDSIKFLAIVKSKAKPFGRFGDLDCFVKELARLTGEKVSAIERAIKRLKAKNKIPRNPPLKYFPRCSKSIYDAFKAGKGIKRMLSNACRDEPNAFQLALLFLSLMRRGEFETFYQRIKGWKPKNKTYLKLGLEEAINWYLEQSRGQKKQVAKWRNKWYELFDLGEEIRKKKIAG
jgi:hypothetical protein